MTESHLGFMQGRLSPVVDGVIQQFPWNHWEQEFAIASELGLCLMEWTLDQDRLYQNPLMTAAGQAAILNLSDTFGVAIQSLTGDCFMQSPFWKRVGAEKLELQNDFMAILDSCQKIGISIVVVPLVDEGRIANAQEMANLVEFLSDITPWLEKNEIRIAFESDFTPCDLKDFIGRFPDKIFGINYDIGNSAALGFNVEEEFAAYGNRVFNVHVKDRILGGTTVPLGSGNTDFIKVFRSLRKIGYKGSYILQTARAPDGDHAGVLRQYAAMTEKWILGDES